KTGKVDYAAALRSGKPLIHSSPDPACVGSCGQGFHVSPTSRKTIQFSNRTYRPFRWFEVEVQQADVIAQDSEKIRVRALRVVREISLADIFGADFGARVEAARAEAATWKDIPWLKPTRRIEDAELAALVGEWREAIAPWLRAGAVLPDKVRIVRTYKDAAADDAAADAGHPAAHPIRSGGWRAGRWSCTTGATRSR